ncbi:MAG: hypothetical protein KF729_09785 [Sandaracinaceae bacterium]|nr:hypothetical protein [Sandaracinaceae bacterium]
MSVVSSALELVERPRWRRHGAGSWAARAPTSSPASSARKRSTGSFGATYAYGLSRADAECLASGALDAVEERPLVERFLELALTRHFERRAL